MSVLENREKVEKAITALRDYNRAKMLADKAGAIVQEKLSVLKTMTGTHANNAPAIEEEVLRMLGTAAMNGVFEQ